MVGVAGLDNLGLQYMISLLSVSMKIFKFSMKLATVSPSWKATTSSGVKMIRGSVFVALSTISKQLIWVLVSLDILVHSRSFSTLAIFLVSDSSSFSESLNVKSMYTLVMSMVGASCMFVGLRDWEVEGC